MKTVAIKWTGHNIEDVDTLLDKGTQFSYLQGSNEHTERIWHRVVNGAYHAAVWRTPLWKVLPLGVKWWEWKHKYDPEVLEIYSDKTPWFDTAQPGDMIFADGTVRKDSLV
jgi:hypothetical protein